MFREIKNLLYIFFIFFFIFFCVRYYFSDDNIKNSFRSINSIDDKISTNDKNLIILKNNTENIIEYIGEKNNENEKEFKFFELLKKN